MVNPQTAKTLDEAVLEVLGTLTGLDLTYRPDMDRYRVIVRQLNRALAANALEHEWSYYSSLEDVGVAHAGDRKLTLRSSVRLRKVGDDAVRLTTENGDARVWAYILPRESLHKYVGRPGLWCSITRDVLEFSRPLHNNEAGFRIKVPVMREPRLFELPPLPDTDVPVPDLPQSTRDQLLDFDYPDMIIARAAALNAQSDPLHQPRAQYLEDQWKDMMYQLVERDDQHTDAPYLNEFFVPIESDIYGGYTGYHPHPHSDERRWG